jgi:hypothetical protein
MKLLSFSITALALSFLALPAMANGIDCTTVVGNLVANCGFENGVSSSTIGGNTNNSVPVSWTADAGYDLEPSFNHTTAGPVDNGSFALSIGNDDGQPVPSLSQTLTDVLGATYSGSLYVYYGGAGTSDPNPFFQVLIDGVALVNLNNTAPASYQLSTFSFTGTGSDTLTIQGNTSPSEWYVDDVSVTGLAPSATPEPRTAFPLAVASLMCGAFWLRKRHANQ